jgi:uncharacterized protein (DUF2062 family)
MDPLPPTLVGRIRAKLGSMLRWLVRLRGSPEAIGLGVAIGTFVAFTPTIGLQLVLSATLATLFSASRPAAMLMTVITSPPTIPPIYAFTYWLGSFFWSGPPVSDVTAALGDAVERLTSYGWSELGAQLTVFASIGVDVFVPLWIGGVLVGIVTGGASYLPTVRFVRFSRRRAGRLRRAAQTVRSRVHLPRRRR